ncbi:MAG TPA: BolA family protein [Alphaproteobacteria bacterium]|nr:BolA family protein [Alphaproteobacteria bacterium]
MTEEKTYQMRLKEKLTAALHPIHLEIQDDSKRHAGHSGHDPRGETHFIVTVVSDAFEGLNAVGRHRLVYGAVEAELKERVHALNIKALSPAEYNHR